mmetsp:Transcript_9277/g.19669  ORF Transcript_9277/g.19669 Transcript_9277/m.19669 type:complete len:209 (-) Transcript_9277:575-1201(-)
MLAHVPPLRLRRQFVQLIQKSVDVIQQFRGRFGPIAVVKLTLDLLLAVHVGHVELPLLGGVRGSQQLIQKHVPNLLGHVAGVRVEQHAIVRVSHVLQLGIDVRDHDLAERRGGRFVQEAVSREQLGRVGRIAVTHAQGGAGGDVPGGAGVAVPLVVVGQSDLLVRGVVEHVRKGHDAQIAAAVLGLEGSRVRDLKRPLAKRTVVLGLV